MRTIAWDVDDVLNDLMRHWLDHAWVPRHGDCSYQSLTCNPPHEQLNITRGEFLASLDEFRGGGVYEWMQPRPEILRWFGQHGDKYRHIALTAVPLRYADLSSSWVVRHFGKWIRSFCFVPSHRQDTIAPQYDQTKAQFLAWLGKVDVFLDDSPENVRQASDIGVRSILVKQPWNSGVGLETALREIAAEENECFA